VGHFGKYNKYNAAPKAINTRITNGIYEFIGCSYGDTMTINLNNITADNIPPSPNHFSVLIK
jgi:hypothetical protein